MKWTFQIINLFFHIIKPINVQNYFLNQFLEVIIKNVILSFKFFFLEVGNEKEIFFFISLV